MATSTFQFIRFSLAININTNKKKGKMDMLALQIVMDVLENKQGVISRKLHIFCCMYSPLKEKTTHRYHTAGKIDCDIN